MITVLIDQPLPEADLHLARISRELLSPGTAEIRANSDGTEVLWNAGATGGYRIHLTGTGLTTDGSRLTGGSVTGFRLEAAGTGVVATVTGFGSTALDLQSRIDAALQERADTGETLSFAVNLFLNETFFDAPFRVVGSGGAEAVTGGRKADVLLGKGGDDTLSGGRGDDDIRGGPGDDLIVGNLGDDALRGFAGDDTITAGKGGDTLWGHAGEDSFRFLENTGDNTVMDFTPGERIVVGQAPEDVSLRQIDGTPDAILEAGGLTVTLRNVEAARLETSPGPDGSGTLVEFSEPTAGGPAVRVKIDDFLNTSYQRIILEALRDPGLRLFPAFDGTAMTLGRSGFSEEPSLYLEGKRLGFAMDGSPKGRIESISVIPDGTPEPAVSVLVGVNLQNLLTLAHKIAAPVTDLSGKMPRWVDFLDRVTPDTARIVGDAGTNVLEGDENTFSIEGKGGDDIIIVTTTTHAIAGGTGKDTVTFEGATGPVLYSAQEGRYALHDDVAVDVGGIEQVVGSPFSDTLTGGTGADTIFGLGGADAIAGSGASDELHGENGRDTIHGESGRDLLFGEAHADELYGGRHKDTLDGGSGNDTLFGGPGADSLMGGFGNDQLDGGKGNDILNGGPGADTFKFKFGVSFFEDRKDVLRHDGRDTIEDFDIGTDIVRIDAFHASEIRLRLFPGEDGTVLFYGAKGAKGEGRIEFRGDFFGEELLESPTFLQIV